LTRKDREHTPRKKTLLAWSYDTDGPPAQLQEALGLYRKVAGFRKGL